MRKALLWILIGMALCPAAYAGTVVETDFGNGWNGLSYVGSSWALDPTGGPDDSQCARLDPIDGNHGKNVISKNVLSYNTDEYWVEFDFKMTGSNVKGGSKFVKFEGKDTDDIFGNDNNLTYGIEQYSGTLRDVSYYLDTICKASYDGVEQPWWSSHCTSLDYYVTSGPIAPNDNAWHHFKAYVRRADPGVANGVSRIWYDRVEVFHAYNMESNPLGGDATEAFDNITLMGYIATTGTNAWISAAAYGEIYVDNLYIGTTEKASGPDTTPPGLSNPQPTGTLPIGTSQTTISVRATDPSGVAGCKYGTSDSDYDTMPDTLSSNSGDTWDATVSGLTGGSSYTYYVRCIDSLGNASADPAQIRFAVSANYNQELFLIYMPAILSPRR